MANVIKTACSMEIRGRQRAGLELNIGMVWAVQDCKDCNTSRGRIKLALGGFKGQEPEVKTTAEKSGPTSRLGCSLRYCWNSCKTNGQDVE